MKINKSFRLKGANILQQGLLMTKLERNENFAKLQAGLTSGAAKLGTNEGYSGYAFSELLEKVQVVTIPGASFGPDGEGFLHISSFASRENCEEACRRFRALYGKEILPVYVQDDIQLLNDLENKLAKLEADSSRQKQLFALSDLSMMFRYYYMKYIPDWTVFVESFCDMRAKLVDNEIDQLTFDAFIEPHNKIVDIDVISLIEISQAVIGQGDNIRSAHDQRVFLSDCKKLNFDADLQPFASSLFVKLDNVVLKRMQH